MYSEYVKKPDGKMPCPVCGGKGSIHEDETEYTFVTRDPDTHVCLTCQGTGRVGPQKKLPNGKACWEIVKNVPGTVNVGTKPSKTEYNPEPDPNEQGRSAWAWNMMQSGATVHYKRLVGDVLYEHYCKLVDGILYVWDKIDKCWTIDNRIDESNWCHPDFANGWEVGEPEDEEKLTHVNTDPLSEAEQQLIVQLRKRPAIKDLLLSGKKVIIVPEDCPVYMDCAEIYRSYQQKRGTWMQQDEEEFTELLLKQYKRLKEAQL